MNLQQSNVRLGDPHICSDAQNRLNILSTIFEALVRRDARGRFQPALATDWRVSADARAWTFTMRRGVRCQSGAPISAHEAAASLLRACGPTVGGELGTEGVYASYLGDAEISALHEQTLHIVTARPMADLLDLLVDIPILSQRGLESLPGELIGTGPYRFVESNDEEVVLEAFNGYWGGAPKHDRLIWQAEPDEATRIDNLLAGRADLITDVTPSGGRQIEASASNARYHTQPSNLCVLFMCNAQAGLCADRRVRQALNYALDVPAMIRRAGTGAAQPLNGPLTPLHFGHNAQTASYTYNPERARDLLAQAGCSEETQLILDVPTSLPDEAQLLAQMMAEYYAAVGLQAEIRLYADRPAYAHMVKAKQIHDACCFDSSPLSTYRVLREKLNSEVGGPWWQGYHNAKVNRLLAQAAATPAEAARRTIYQAAYHLIHDDAPWIFLYSPVRGWGIGPNAKQVRIGMTGRLEF